MSFCPSKDLHSVYLDNELPEIYKAEYEAHVKNCPECQKKLEQLKALHSLFAKDSSSVTPDSHYMDQSFERLMVKMNYSKNSSVAKSKSFQINLRYLGYAATGIAAAAVFALVVPFGLNVSKKYMQKTENVLTLATNSAISTNQNGTVNNVALNSGRSVVISGNIEKSVHSFVNDDKSFTSHVAQNVNLNGNLYSGNRGNMINDVEVFRPDINRDQTISIRVTVPGMNAVPVTTVLEVPVSVLLGR